MQTVTQVNLIRHRILSSLRGIGEGVWHSCEGRPAYRVSIPRYKTTVRVFAVVEDSMHVKARAHEDGRAVRTRTDATHRAGEDDTGLTNVQAQGKGCPSHASERGQKHQPDSSQSPHKSGEAG